MKISRIKIIAFFAALLILGWFLYPRALFLGFIYEGLAELQQSEKYYRQYLEDRPFSKFGTMRLANLYDRMGEPEKAAGLLKNLYEYRRNDWKMAQKYLEVLENAQDEEKLYTARLEIARHFMTLSRFSKRRVEEMLHDSLQYALWAQKGEEVIYGIVSDLMRVGKNPKAFSPLVADLDRGFQKTGKRMETLQKNLLEDPGHVEDRVELAGIYAVMKKAKEGYAVVDKGLAMKPGNTALLKVRAHLDDLAGDDVQAKADLEKLLSSSKLSQDDRLDYTVQLAGVLGRLGEKERSLKLFRNVLRQDPDTEDHWLNLVSALVDARQTDEAMETLRKFHERFGAQVEKDRQTALGLDVASLLIDHKRFEEGRQWLLFLAGQSPFNAKIMARVGREFLFLGDYEAAQAYLEKAVALNPKDAASWFWLSEKEWSQEHKLQSLAASRKVVALLGRGAALKNEEARMALKSRGRLRFTQGVINDYEMAIAANPKNLEWQADFLDLLLDNKKMALARQTFRETLGRFPEHGNRLRPYEVRLAFEERRYREALPLLEKMVEADSASIGVRRDLAHAYAQTGQWKKAMREYGQVGPAKPLKKLHQTFDNRATALFNFVDYGSEEFVVWGGAYRQFLNEHWNFFGEAFGGRFDSPSRGFDDLASFGRLGVGWQNPDWYWKGGAGYGLSPRRKTPSFFSEVGYRLPDLFRGTLGYDYRFLRTDLPEAVAAGNLMDTARLDLQYTPWSRLVMGAKYQFARNTLPAGQKAYEHDFEPTLNMVIFKEPYFTMGYQFTFTEVLKSGNFLNQVSLIQKMRAHYLTGAIRKVVEDDLALEATGFIGEDTARDLQFVEGELWGAGAALAWHAFKGFDLEIAYDYGKEALFDVPGRYQNVKLVLSGHW